MAISASANAMSTSSVLPGQQLDCYSWLLWEVCVPSIWFRRCTKSPKEISPTIMYSLTFAFSQAEISEQTKQIF